jgi:hypothetical protein
MPRVGGLVLLTALVLGAVQADEGSSLAAQLFDRPDSAAALSAAGAEGNTDAAAFQQLAFKQQRPNDQLAGFKRYMDSELLPRGMLQSRGREDHHVTEMKPLRRSLLPRVQPRSMNPLEQAIAALKSRDFADSQEEPFRDQAQDGDAEESEAEVAKKQKEWIMMQEILRLRGLLRAEEQKKEKEAQWVKEQNLRNEEWAMGQVAHAQIAAIKKQEINRVTKAEVFAKKAFAAQRFTTAATAIRTALDHLRMHKVLAAVNLRYVLVIAARVFVGAWPC